MTRCIYIEAGSSEMFSTGLKKAEEIEQCILARIADDLGHANDPTALVI